MIFDKYFLIATVPWCTYKQTGQNIIDFFSFGIVYTLHYINIINNFF